MSPLYTFGWGMLFSTLGIHWLGGADGWWALAGLVVMLVGMVPWKVEHVRRGASIYGRFTVLHAARGGGPVRRGESSWRTVCGVMLQGSEHRWIIVWREDGA